MHLRNQNLVELKRWIEEGVKHLSVTGISGTARVFFIAQLLQEMDRPCLLLLPDAKAANRFYRELEFFLPEAYVQRGTGERRLFNFPIYDISPLAGLSPHRDVITRRLEALYALTAEPNPLVVTSVEAVTMRILPKDALINALEYMELGEELDRETLLQRLHTNGYFRTSLVEEMGDYSVRGGVVDIFPPVYLQPIRLEFWGDRIESIRHFDTLTQRSTEHLKEVTLLPANEIVMDRENVHRARSMGRLPGLFQDMSSFPGQEAWLNHFYSHLHTLFDYFPRNGLLTLIDPHRIEQGRTRFSERVEKESERYRQEAEERESPFPEIDGLLLSHTDLDQCLDHYQRMDFSVLAIEKQGPLAKSLHIGGIWTVDEDLDVRVAGRGRVSMAPLAEKISEWLDLGSRVILVCRTVQQANRLKEILGNYEVHVDELVDRWEEISGGHGLSICLGRLPQGFAWADLGIFVVSEDEIFGSKRPRAKAPVGVGEDRISLTAFSQINVGDLVVHQEHGIGRYSGLCKMEIEKKANDFLLVEYAHNDRLYVPADRITILQKYIGADERNPKLDRLGGRSWDLAKEKAKKAIREIAKQLVEIYALRKYRKGYAFSLPDNTFREFEATFEHVRRLIKSKLLMTSCQIWKLIDPWTGWSAVTWVLERPRWP